MIYWFVPLNSSWDNGLLLISIFRLAWTFVVFLNHIRETKTLNTIWNYVYIPLQIEIMNKQIQENSTQYYNLIDRILSWIILKRNRRFCELGHCRMCDNGYQNLYKGVPFSTSDCLPIATMARLITIADNGDHHCRLLLLWSDGFWLLQEFVLSPCHRCNIR